MYLRNNQACTQITLTEDRGNRIQGAMHDKELTLNAECIRTIAIAL